MSAEAKPGSRAGAATAAGTCSAKSCDQLSCRAFSYSSRYLALELTGRQQVSYYDSLILYWNLAISDPPAGASVPPGELRFFPNSNQSAHRLPFEKRRENVYTDGRMCHLAVGEDRP